VSTGSPREASPDASVPLEGGIDLDVRELQPEDVHGLRRLHARLSQKSRYRRFMTATPRLSERSLAYLVDVDHAGREALVAEVGGEILAEARYHRAPGSTDAEIAVVVEDAWQRRGIGRILVERLADRARRRGVRAFTGSMLAENVPAAAGLRALFPDATLKLQGPELVFRAPLCPARSTAIRPEHPDPSASRWGSGSAA
jgi:GNAT superfamily N-acetyltransferase